MRGEADKHPASAKEMENLGQRLKAPQGCAVAPSIFNGDCLCTADISRPTLYKVENGDLSIVIGAYIHVLRVLGLVEDLLLIAKEDALGRRLRDESLSDRKRAPRMKLSQGEDLG